MLHQPIYLDYAATTPIDPRVAEKMQTFLFSKELFGNPSSLHSYGKKAKDAIEIARAQVAALLQAELSEIIFTSGATESINLAIKGIAHLLKRKGQHIVTVKTEHKATLDTCQYLEKSGYAVTYLSPLPNGHLDLDQLVSVLREDTLLVSVMQVNNETGVIHDLDAIAEITSSRAILLHVDAAQSVGKVEIDLNHTPIDLLSLSSHKVYGPKGIGALYLRKKPRVRVEALLHGGGHEQGMRSGTLATHQIVGMGEAFHLARENREQDFFRICDLRKQFLEALKPIHPIKPNTNEGVVPHILSLRFEGMIADEILAQSSEVVAASTASACQGKGTEGSYVLRAMGFNAEQIKNSIRFSFGRFTKATEIQTVTDHLLSLFRQ